MASTPVPDMPTSTTTVQPPPTPTSDSNPAEETTPSTQSTSTTTEETSTTEATTEPTTTTSSTTAEPTETTTVTSPTPTSTSTEETSTTPTTTTTTTTTTDPPTSTSTTTEPDLEPTSTEEPEPTSTTTTITITSTSLPTTSTDAGASSTIDPSATASPTETGDGDSGLSAGGTIAVAVVVPVVSVAILILVGLWLWRRHKAKKVAEEERRKEVEEYGFNPNGDPTLPAVMGGAADDNSGYRGWGTTSAGRKASTNMSSSAGVGLAMSEAGSQPGYNHAATPSDGTIQYSEGHDALGETEPYGVLGAAPIAAVATNQRNPDIHRGPSNASSAYSAGNHSDISEESHMSANHLGGPYYDDNPYYTDMHHQYQAYSDPYAGGQPVIRDVQARRNTQIQNPSVFPRQGNAGIAQNF